MEPETLAEIVREACVQAALEAFSEGGSSGLCAEGRLELAVGAMRALDLGRLLRQGPNGAYGARLASTRTQAR